MSVPYPCARRSPHARQLTVEAAVHDAGCRSRRRSRRADSCRATSSITTCLPLERAAEPAGQRGAVALGQRHRRPHAGADSALRGVEQAAVGVDDRPKMIGPAVGRDERKEVPAELGQLQALAISSAILRLAGRRDPRAAQHRGELSVTRHGEATFSSSPWTCSAWLRSARQLEERLGVGLGDARAMSSRSLHRRRWPRPRCAGDPPRAACGGRASRRRRRRDR